MPNRLPTPWRSVRQRAGGVSVVAANDHKVAIGLTEHQAHRIVEASRQRDDLLSAVLEVKSAAASWQNAAHQLQSAIDNAEAVANDAMKGKP